MTEQRSSKFGDGREDAGDLTRRGLLSASAALAVTSFVSRPRWARADNLKFAVAMGFSTAESGRHLIAGYKEAVANLGGEVSLTDAGGDPKRQADQIDTLISKRPSALFIAPADAVAIAPAVNRAIAAGIPVFTADSMVPGALVTTSCISNNFGMGQYNAHIIAQRLNGKGNVASITLPQNESWDQRTQGMQFAFSQYPDIKIVGSWEFSLTGQATPRQGTEGLLTAHPELNAIWCAWDGAAMQGTLATQAAGRDDVFFTGIDGGKQAFEYLRAAPAFAISMAQSFYEMAYLNVLYAHKLVAGERVPRLVVTPAYAVTKDMLKSKDLPDDYDVPGVARKLGWARAV